MVSQGTKIKLNLLSENIDSKIQAIRISSKVGDKKREMIVNRADEMKIRVLNRRDL